MRTGIIYMATSSVTGKSYIGQTVQKLEKRKKRHLSNAFNSNSKTHNTHFSCAIRKYGKKEWIWKPLYINISEENLNIAEICAIYTFDTYDSGYNSTKGGEINPMKCPKIAKKVSKALKGNMSGKNNPMYGKHHTKESKKKISNAAKGREHTKEARKKISDAGKGRRHTKEARKKMSDAGKGEKNSIAKLTWKKVSEIREKFAVKNYSYSELLKEYSVSRATICNIINNKSWKEE